MLNISSYSLRKKVVALLSVITFIFLANGVWSFLSTQQIEHHLSEATESSDELSEVYVKVSDAAKDMKFKYSNGLLIFQQRVVRTV